MVISLHGRKRFISAYKRHGRTLEQYAYLVSGNAVMAKVVALMVLTDYLFNPTPGTNKGSKKKHLMKLTRQKCKALGWVKITQTSAGKIVPFSFLKN